MQLRRSPFIAGAPIALGLAVAAPAIAAAPAVSVRVESAQRTLLPARTVTAPAHGSITKGGAPAGACPADTAAGALTAATGGRWTGSYDSGLGIEVNSILGTALSYARGSYWGFYVDDHFASHGVCATRLHPGESLLFAQVPAKGRTPLPIVLRAPATARAGTPFTVRAVDLPGAGPATRPVSDVHLRVTAGPGHRTGARVGRDVAGATAVSVASPGTVTIVASAPHTIRSAAVTVRVTR
jgi:hypothetical protein